jgi:hypothetical protein
MEAVQMKMMTQTLHERKGIECNWVQAIGCQASAIIIITFTHFVDDQ